MYTMIFLCLFVCFPSCYCLVILLQNGGEGKKNLCRMILSTKAIVWAVSVCLVWLLVFHLEKMEAEW